MAATLPAALKAADIQRFATRAAQLEKYKPIVTYWLEYYILQRIIKDALHEKSAEAAEYAAQLMDKLEQTKAEYATESAITDDVAAKAYMEQFATQTFDRGEKAQNDNTVTRQTADTFQAAATFLDALSIWGDIDSQSKAMSKFAKFHALRIARALKEGKDPNETNPKVEAPATATDENEDAELRELEREINAAARQPVVESVPDEDSGPSGARTIQPEVSPVDADVPVSAGPVSAGDGYFPSVPTTTDQKTAVGVDIKPPPTSEGIQGTGGASIISPNINNETHIPVEVPTDPADFYTAPPSVPVPPQPTIPQMPPPSAGSYRTDDEAVFNAQKHAKWAISALNFEDVPTAVKELRIALQSLGGL